MSEISIPFREDMAERSLAGTKTATSRNKKYGGPGDTFPIKDVRFELVRVTKQFLNTIASARYQQEGFSSPVEFIDVWVELHPKNGWEPHKQVWFHEYRRLQ